MSPKSSHQDMHRTRTNSKESAEFKIMEHVFDELHVQAETNLSGQQGTMSELLTIQERMKQLSNTFGDMNMLRENFSPSPLNNGLIGSSDNDPLDSSVSKFVLGPPPISTSTSPSALRSKRRASRLNSLSPLSNSTNPTGTAITSSSISSNIRTTSTNRYPLRKTSVSAMLKLAVLPTPKLKDRRKSSINRHASFDLWHDTKKSETALLFRKELVYFDAANSNSNSKKRKPKAATVFFSASSPLGKKAKLPSISTPFSSFSSLQVQIQTEPTSPPPPSSLINSDSSSHFQPMFEHGNNLSPTSHIEQRRKQR